MGYPQKNTMTWFCPLWDDSGARDRCTGFWRTQVRDAKDKKPVIHKKTGPLLLRLCIYRNIRREDRGELLRPVHPGFDGAGVFEWRRAVGAQKRNERQEKEVAWRRESSKSAPEGLGVP